MTNNTSIVLCDDLRPDIVMPWAHERGWGLEVQALCDPHFPSTDPDAVYYLRDKLHGISLRALHGPYEDLFPGSLDPEVQNVARMRFESAYRLATQIDTSHIIVHYGYIPETSPLERWCQRSTIFWKSFLEGRNPKVNFHLENVFETKPECMLGIVNEVASPQLDLCLDIGHAHCYSNVPVTKWIEVLNEKIGYVHLHDNAGYTDEHLAFGEGSVPMRDVCRALREHAPNAIWALEATHDRLKKSIEWLEAEGFLSNS